MDPERWRRIEAIFFEALDLPAAERGPFLTEACGGDAALRAEVDSLLASENEAQDNLEAAVVGAARGLEPGLYQSDVGRILGQYELIREIGRGGMGSVFMAKRTDGQFEHAVAVKLVHKGMDSEFIVARFLQERQILASLNHPNIAGIIDGGTTDDGRPYFVMEYIEGLPIVEFAETHQIDLAARVEIFRNVCSAVHYAHQKLVIHRDLKPGNILVMSNGVPKLLDFGISKLLAPGPSGEMSPRTITSVRLMTPDYASPEQVRGEDITTASDVYSLGALLYELLTGLRPYTTTGQSPYEIEQAVCMKDPPPPSQAPQTPDKLRKGLQGDLDTIVLMAMRKEPERRYSSAQALSEDLDRYLKGLPVAARKDTIRYRFSKMIRRNRVYVVAACLLVVAILGGLWSTYYQMRRAERRFQQVRRLANSFLFDIHEKIRTLPGSIPAREALVATALEYLDSLASESASDASLTRELATAYLKVGDVQGHVLTSNLGRTAEAIRSYEKAAALVRPLKDRESRRILAQAHSRLGDNLFYMGDAKSSAAHYETGIALAEEERKATPDDAALLRNLSRMYRQLASVQARTSGDALATARKSAERVAHAAQVSPADEDTRSEMATSLSQLGSLLMRRNDLKGALETYQRSRDLTRMLTEKNPDSTTHWRDLMIVHGHIGDILGSPTRANLGDVKGSLTSYGEMLKIARKLAGDKHDKRSDSDYAIALMRMANAVPEDGEAVAMFQESARLMDSLVTQDPKNHRNRQNLTFTYGRLGARQAARGDAASASQSFARAIELSETLLKADASDSDNARMALGVFSEYIPFLIKQGKAAAAAQWADRAFELAQKTNAKKGVSLYEAIWVPRTLALRGDVARSHAVACELYRASAAAWQDLRGRSALPSNQEAEAVLVSRKLVGCASHRPGALSNSALATRP